MSELDRARQQKCALYSRIKQVRSEAQAADDPVGRRSQKERLRLLGEMYKEACAEVRRLEGKAAAAPLGGKKQPSQIETAAACGALWSDLEAATWSRAEGRGWSDLPDRGTGRQMERIRELVRGGMSMCTPRQQDCLNAYYGQGLTLEEIGQRDAVDTSTVSRTLKRGRERVGQYVTAKLLLGRCVDEHGRFDYMKFLNSVSILTERQKEMVYLILASDATYGDIADYVQRTPATVQRTAQRAQEKLSTLALRVDGRRSAIRVERAHWAGRSEKQLAEELGLSPAFYYRVVRRGACVDGVPLLHCAILHRLARGECAQHAARELGCTKALVRKVARRYAQVPLPPFAEEYRPSPVTRARLPENPLVLWGGGQAVIDCIDAVTYQKLQERFCTADALQGAKN